MCRKISGSRSKKYSQVSSSKKNSRSVEPRSVSGYFSSVFLHVSNRRPDTLMSIFSSSGLRLSFNTGGGGRGLAAMGTQPTAAARANGNQAGKPKSFHFSAKVWESCVNSPAATEAMCGGIFLFVVESQDETQSARRLPSVSSLCQRSRNSFCRFQMNANRKLCKLWVTK